FEQVQHAATARAALDESYAAMVGILPREPRDPASRPVVALMVAGEAGPALIEKADGDRVALGGARRGVGRGEQIQLCKPSRYRPPAVCLRPRCWRLRARACYTSASHEGATCTRRQRAERPRLPLPAAGPPAVRPRGSRGARHERGHLPAPLEGGADPEPRPA